MALHNERLPRSPFVLGALLVLTILGPVSFVQGDSGAVDALAERGLALVALRNDTIDTNQDGDIDAVRVVAILNSTAAQNDLIIKLRGLHKEREVLEVQEISFVGQTNITLLYDAWSSGEHKLRLDFFDEDGVFIASYPLPTFQLRPSLQIPMLRLNLEADSLLQTGESCIIQRMFDDQTGPRYGETGLRTFTGAPFSVLDHHDELDCSTWPAGSYQLKETYRNGLGQTAEAYLNFSINNRPAPEFELTVMGEQHAVGTLCEVKMTTDAPNPTWAKVWRIRGAVVEGANTTVLDCSNLPAGSHLITLEVITTKQISSIQGLNLVRLASNDSDTSANTTGPSYSLGPATPTQSVGWMSIGVLALLVAVIVFLSLVRTEAPTPHDLPQPGAQPQLLEDGSPDHEGMPTIVDDQGVLWRRHPSGDLDWWDRDWQRWHRWE